MAKKILNLDTVTGAKSWGDSKAVDSSLDTANFNKNLNGTITDVQKLADAVDELEFGGTQIQSDWNQTNNTQLDYIKNKPTIPAGLPNATQYQTLFYNSGWNSTSVVESKPSGLVVNGTNSGTGAIQAKNTNTMSLSICYEAQLFSPNGYLFYGYSPNVMVTISATGEIVSSYYKGTGDRPIFADSNGKLKIGTNPTFTQVNADWNATSGVAEILNKPTLPTKIEHLSTSLSGTKYTVTRATLGITGDLRDRIKFMKVWIKNSSGGDLRKDKTLDEYISADTISIESDTEFAGNYVKIILYIE